MHFLIWKLNIFPLKLHCSVCSVVWVHKLHAAFHPKIMGFKVCNMHVATWHMQPPMRPPSPHTCPLDACNHFPTKKGGVGLAPVRPQCKTTMA